MATPDLQAILRQCTHVLNGDPPRTTRSRLEKIAASPLALAGTDHYGRGGVLADFEEEIAALLGKEAAVFMPSGTMAQQIALRIWSDRVGSKRVAFHPTCHLEIHEQMAYRELHGLEATLLGEADRLFTLADLEGVPDPVAALLIELPQREIGGQLPTWDDLNAIVSAARRRGIHLHLDGARFWECLPAYQRTSAEIAGLFDTVYVSFYKILAGYPGAILAGPTGVIAEARIWQRRHGGNLQQQTPSVLAAKIGLAERLPRIPLYVARAQEVAAVLKRFDGIRIVPEHPPTNMMHLHFSGDPERLLRAAIQIAEQERTGLFFFLNEKGKTELTIAEGALDLPDSEIERLFVKLFALAGSP